MLYSQEVQPAPDYKDGDIVVIQYSANWCGPCRILSNLIKNDAELQGLIKTDTKGYFFIDIENPKTQAEQDWLNRAIITSLPTVVKYVYKNGTWVKQAQFKGYRDKQFLLKWLSTPKIQRVNRVWT